MFLCVFDCFQLPGFYFDPDKKRYFRIQSGHGNVMPCSLTAKIFASKGKDIHKQSPVLPAADAVRRQRVDAAQNGFVTDFQNMQIGQAKRLQILSGIVRNLTWHNLVPVLPVLDHEEEYDINKCYLKQIFCTTDENQLICRWCLQRSADNYLFDSSNSVLQRFEISDAPKASSECTVLRCLPAGIQHNANQFKGIMSACIAETDVLADCQVTPVLYTAALQGQPFVLDAVAVLDSLDSNSFSRLQTSRNFRTFRVGKKWVWSCAWSPGLNNQFAVGTEQLAFLFDVNTGRRFVLNTQSSDVLAQVFTSPVSVALFCG